jgi:hypothetical protein
VSGCEVFSIAVVGLTGCRAGARFSLTVSMSGAVCRAVAGVEGRTWTAIRYPNAVVDDEVGVWISDAEVSETVFAGVRHQVTARLVVCRVRRESPSG